MPHVAINPAFCVLTYRQTLSASTLVSFFLFRFSIENLNILIVYVHLRYIVSIIPTLLARASPDTRSNLVVSTEAKFGDGHALVTRLTRYISTLAIG